MLVLKFITSCSVRVGVRRVLFFFSREKWDFIAGAHFSFPCSFFSLDPGHTEPSLLAHTRTQHTERSRRCKHLSVSVCGADGSWLDGRRINEAGRRESATSFQSGKSSLLSIHSIQESKREIGSLRFSLHSVLRIFLLSETVNRSLISGERFNVSLETRVLGMR